MHSLAQQKGRDSILILDNEYAEYIKEGNTSVQKLVNHVKVQHGSDTLFCDSAFFYQDKNSLEAFGDARIMQADGTIAFADYMRYTGNNKTAYMRGDASVASGQDNLWAEEMEYNLGTHIGKYRKGGTLQTATTIITSEEADYNTQTKDARFRKNVVVEDVDYNATSSDMGYNTATEVVVFYGPSEVVNQQSVLQTSSGTYDSKNKIARFANRPNIRDSAYYIEGDFIDYNKNTGYAKARGNVIAIDSANKRTLYSDYAQYNELTEDFIAYGEPIAKMVRNSDSFYIRGEIFLAGLESNFHKNDSLSAQDSIQRTLDQLNRAAQQGQLGDSSILNNVDSVEVDYDTLQQNEKDINNGAAISKEAIPIDTTIDTINDANVPDDNLQTDLTPSMQEDIVMLPSPTPPDTSKRRYFITYHHVLIYSDSLQGRCDSLSYFQSDSLLRMFYQPVLWSGAKQINGDTILAKLDSNSIKQVYVPRNGIMISRSGPEKAAMFDQIQGNKMWAYFTDNNIDSVIAAPNAATIYFATDDEDAYIGASEVTSDKVAITFDTTGDGQEIKKIKYDKSVSSTMTPMKDVEPSQLRLSRFKWLVDKRPKTLEDFMNEDYSQSLTDSNFIRRISEFSKDSIDIDSSKKMTAIKDSLYTNPEKHDNIKKETFQNKDVNNKSDDSSNNNEKVPSFTDLIRQKQEEKKMRDSVEKR